MGEGIGSACEPYNRYLPDKFVGLAAPVHQALGDFIETTTLMRRCCDCGVRWNVGVWSFSLVERTRLFRLTKI
jgi:hypothetical protein